MPLSIEIREGVSPEQDVIQITICKETGRFTECWVNKPSLVEEALDILSSC